MNISPEPAARPLPDQQAEHDYQNDPGDITMANDHLNGDSGQGLMDDATLEDLLRGIEVAADNAGDDMDLDGELDMSALINFDPVYIEMRDATTQVDPTNGIGNREQAAKMVNVVKDQTDGSKDSDVPKTEQDPNNSPNSIEPAKSTLMGTVIRPSASQTMIDKLLGTEPLNGDEMGKSVKVSKLVRGDVEGGEGKGAGQAGGGVRSSRCLVEESSPEPDGTEARNLAKRYPANAIAAAPAASNQVGRQDNAKVNATGSARTAKLDGAVDDDPSAAPTNLERTTEKRTTNAAAHLATKNGSQNECSGETEICNDEIQQNAGDHDKDFKPLLNMKRKDSMHVASDQASTLPRHEGSNKIDSRNSKTTPHEPLEIADPEDEDALYGHPAPIRIPAQPNARSPGGADHLKQSLSLEHDDLAQVSDDVLNEENNDYVDFSYPAVSDTPDAPTLSLAKLVVLAFAKSRSRSLRLASIIDGIKAMSKYYSAQVPEDGASAPSWIKKVEDILHDFDFPIHREVEEDEFTFTLPNGGEWFVLNKSDRHAGGPFKIRKLPLEARLKIYTFTLQLPLPKRCGWAVDRGYTLDPNRHEIFNDPNRTPQYLTSKVAGIWELRSRPLPELLALTRTSKAIQKETLPVFYRTNVFYFPQPLVMGRFLSGLPNRLQWIRNVILNFAPPVRNHQAKRSIGWLFSTKLRNLHLIVNEQELTIKHCVPEITDVPGVKFLAELSGLDKVGFSGECPNLKRYLAKASITSFKRGRGKTASEWDTDEEIEAQEGRRAKGRLAEMHKAFRNKAKTAQSKERKMKRDLHRKEVAQRAADQAEKKKSKEEIQAREKKRKREERERRRQEREDELEEERERKEANRLAKKAASKRKAQAREDERVAKREERETTRAEKKAAAKQLKKEKQRAAKKEIEEQRRKITEKYGRNAAADESDDEDDTTEDEDSDAGRSTARNTKPKIDWYEASHPSSSSRSPASRRYNSSDDEDLEPPKKKARTTTLTAHKGKAKVPAKAPASKPIAGRSSGHAPKKAPPVSNAMKVAAMRKTLQQGNSGAQVKTSVPAGPSRATPAAKAAPKVVKKKAETVIVSDDSSSDDGESDDEVY